MPLVIWIWLPARHLQAQTSFRPQIGMETWSFKDERTTSGASYHPGQMIGIDFIFHSDRWTFVPGIQYHRLSLVNEDHSFDLNFSDPHHAHYIFMPFMAGYSLMDSCAVQLTGMAGGDLQYFYDADANDIGLTDDMFYGVRFSLAIALKAELWSKLGVAVSYHYGLQPMIKPREDSKMSGWTISAGIKF
jgi:hypothetical protein